MSVAVAAVHTAGLYSASFFCPLCIWLSLRRSSQIAGLFFSQSTSICSWPTFWYKWSRSTSFFSAPLSFPLVKVSGAASSNCFFQILIWLAWTPYSDANSAIVFCPFYCVKRDSSLQFLAVLFSNHLVSPFDWKYTLAHCLIYGVHYNTSSEVRFIQMNQN